MSDVANVLVRCASEYRAQTTTWKCQVCVAKYGMWSVVFITHLSAYYLFRIFFCIVLYHKYTRHKLKVSRLFYIQVLCVDVCLSVRPFVSVHVPKRCRPSFVCRCCLPSLSVVSSDHCIHGAFLLVFSYALSLALTKHTCIVFFFRVVSPNPN